MEVLDSILLFCLWIYISIGISLIYESVDILQLFADWLLSFMRQPWCLFWCDPTTNLFILCYYIMWPIIDAFLLFCGNKTILIYGDWLRCGKKWENQHKNTVRRTFDIAAPNMCGEDKIFFRCMQISAAIQEITTSKIAADFHCGAINFFNNMFSTVWPAN